MCGAEFEEQHGIFAMSCGCFDEFACFGLVMCGVIGDAPAGVFGFECRVKCDHFIERFESAIMHVGARSGDAAECRGFHLSYC